MKAQRRLVDRARFVDAERRSPEREQPLDELGSRFLRGLRPASPSQVAVGAEELARIEAAFGELTAEQQEAISRSRLRGMELHEIAARMQRSEGAVSNLVYHGAEVGRYRATCGSACTTACDGAATARATENRRAGGGDGIGGSRWRWRRDRNHHSPDRVGDLRMV